MPQIEDWQNRPLDDVYPVVYIDAIHYSVRDEGIDVYKRQMMEIIQVTDAQNINVANRQMEGLDIMMDK